MPDYLLKPDETLEIRDNSAAEVFLLRLGMLKRFSDLGDETPSLFVATELEHPTHAILGTRFTGFPERRDNGYAVVCFPKSKFSPEDVNTYVEILRRNGDAKLEGWTATDATKLVW